MAATWEYDADRVREALKTERLAVGGDKTLDRFELKDPPLRPVLWCADDHTLVFSLLPVYFEQVPRTPREVRLLHQPPSAVMRVDG